jgi:hypothetical protein
MEVVRMKSEINQYVSQLQIAMVDDDFTFLSIGTGSRCLTSWNKEPELENPVTPCPDKRKNHHFPFSTCNVIPKSGNNRGDAANSVILSVMECTYTAL